MNSWERVFREHEDKWQPHPGVERVLRQLEGLRADEQLAVLDGIQQRALALSTVGYDEIKVQAHTRTSS